MSQLNICLSTYLLDLSQKKTQFSARFCSSFLQFERTVEIAWRQRGDLAVSTTFGMVSLYACHIVIIDFLCLLKVFFIHKDILKTLFDTLNLPGIFICSTSFGFNRGASREKKKTSLNMTWLGIEPRFLQPQCRVLTPRRSSHIFLQNIQNYKHSTTHFILNFCKQALLT